ncbi:hypothetical protein AVMA1855_22640 [Acidovorax sp. SUPP1855]|uniref:hypothetical protein n=1 Tax=Acidovorax sp. SUPP1855 TaxID=431774 RepID=UPI0023DE4C0E|nr:hypothetical protein [Acidovorax sp. SUPP1855]GKS87002.1 hypothetical protein AVMA1855_22640 [Acidovorax sp. SUPP1855]
MSANTSIEWCDHTLTDVHVCIWPVGSCKARSLPAVRTVGVAVTTQAQEAV